MRPFEKILPVDITISYSFKSNDSMITGRKGKSNLWFVNRILGIMVAPGKNSSVNFLSRRRQYIGAFGYISFSAFNTLKSPPIPVSQS